MNISKNTIPSIVKRYFWDVDVNKLSLTEHTEYIITRLLEYGDVDAQRWLFKIFNKGLIKKTFMHHRGFSAYTINFWSLFLNIDKNDILCLKKPYQKMHKAHWPY